MEHLHSTASSTPDDDAEPTAQDPSDLRRWAADLRERFAEHYWVSTAEGRYPAVALDRHKQPVDSLTSNAGHLLGTGILDPDDEAHIADLMLDPSMSSGYGIRTLSTGLRGIGRCPITVAVCGFMTPPLCFTACNGPGFMRQPPTSPPKWSTRLRASSIGFPSYTAVTRVVSFPLLCLTPRHAVRRRGQQQRLLYAPGPWRPCPRQPTTGGHHRRAIRGSAIPSRLCP